MYARTSKPQEGFTCKDSRAKIKNNKFHRETLPSSDVIGDLNFKQNLLSNIPYFRHFSFSHFA